MFCSHDARYNLGFHSVDWQFEIINILISRVSREQEEESTLKLGSYRKDETYDSLTFIQPHDVTCLLRTKSVVGSTYQ